METQGPTDRIRCMGLCRCGEHSTLGVLCCNRERSCSWDTDTIDLHAGQEIYYNTHQIFFSPRALFLVVTSAINYDVERVEFWLRSICLQLPSSPILMVITHTDDRRCSREHLAGLINHLSTICRSFPKNVKGIAAVSSKTLHGIDKLVETVTNTAMQQVMRRYFTSIFPQSAIA